MLVENELKKLQKFDSSCFRGKSHFEKDGAQNYLVFQPMYNVQSHCDTKARVKFSGSCLKQDKATYNHGKIVNIYIVYEISKNYNISSFLTLENCLFGAVALSKNAYTDQCKYFGYGIGFDRKEEFSFGNGCSRNFLFGEMLVEILFGVELTNLTNNETNNIIVLGKYSIQGTNGTTLYAEKLY